jgi:hypothetical protein
MLKFFQLLLRPFERFVPQWIAVSTEPGKFVRERIRLGDTSNFLRAAQFFMVGVAWAFVIESVIVYWALSEQNSKYLARPSNRSDRPGKMQENQWPQNPVLTFWQSKRICSDNALHKHGINAANARPRAKVSTSCDSPCRAAHLPSSFARSIRLDIEPRWPASRPSCPEPWPPCA